MKTLSYYFTTLDIETTTKYDVDETGKQIPVAVWLAYGYFNLYDKDGLPLERNYFRTWEELRKSLIRLENRFTGYKIYCFVHNLSYEFDFLIKNISKPEKILTNSSHAVISSTLEEYPQFEFRCTYMISAHSLAAVGKEVGLPKLDSDYRFILPHDKVTEKEKKYCVRDNDICARYVVSLIKEYGTLRNIPYTKTGRVRKTFNEFYNSIYNSENPCTWDTMPDEDCYDAMNDAFAGGCVFSNPLFTGIVMKNVHSYDITSSYPYVMLAEKFPYTIKKVPNPDKSLLMHPFWIAKIKFNRIRSRYLWQWLSISKMNDYDFQSAEWFNGKLISSSYIVRTITSTDYRMICKTYRFDSIELLEFYDCEQYDYLPYPYIETIKIYGERKSELKAICKNTPESDPNYMNLQREYMLSKNDFNSIYGMSVQKLISPEYTIDELFQWHEKEQHYEKKDKHLHRNFLFGVWITAYARRNLLNAIIKNCPQTFVYCDTDSIKFIGENNFIDTNPPLPDKFKAIKALSKLGRFDYELTYKQFLTYGAKKYAYTTRFDPSNPKDFVKGVHLTVAGLPKSRPGKMNIYYKGNHFHKLNTIKEFRIGTQFKSCKLGKKYITTLYNFDEDDNYNVCNLRTNAESTCDYLRENDIVTNGGVALYPTDYELDITITDKNYIKEMEEILPSWENQNKNFIHLKKYCDMKYLID